MVDYPPYRPSQDNSWNIPNKESLAPCWEPSISKARSFCFFAMRPKWSQRSTPYRCSRYPHCSSSGILTSGCSSDDPNARKYTARLGNTTSYSRQDSTSHINTTSPSPFDCRTNRPSQPGSCGILGFSTIWKNTKFPLSGAVRWYKASWKVLKCFYRGANSGTCW